MVTVDDGAMVIGGVLLRYEVVPGTVRGFNVEKTVIELYGAAPSNMNGIPVQVRIGVPKSEG